MNVKHEYFIVSGICFTIAIFLTIMLFVFPPIDNQLIIALIMTSSFYMIGILFLWMYRNTKDFLTDTPPRREART